MVRNGKVYVYDRQTLKLKKVTPLPPENIITADVLTVAMELMSATDGAKEFKEMNLSIANNLSSSLKTFEIVVDKLVKSTTN
jgi:hypothetical protein